MCTRWFSLPDLYTFYLVQIYINCLGQILSQCLQILLYFFLFIIFNQDLTHSAKSAVTNVGPGDDTQTRLET